MIDLTHYRARHPVYEPAAQACTVDVYTWFRPMAWPENARQPFEVQIHVRDRENAATLTGTVTDIERHRVAWFRYRERIRILVAEFSLDGPWHARIRR